MSIDKIVSALNQRTSGLDRQLFLLGQDDFASKLTLGQVIKARVLRHHEGSRYLADINGQQKVIDSANPLRPGELIEGRVKALGKQVEIHRINLAAQSRVDTSQDQLPELNQSGLLNKQDQQLKAAQQFFTSKQSSLTVKDIQLLKTFLNNGTPLNALLMSALSLKKAGLVLVKENVEAILKSLQYKQAERPSVNTVPTIALDVDVNSVQSHQAYSEVSKQLAIDLEYQSELASSFYNDAHGQQSNGFSEGDSRENLSYQILNRQDDSVVNHQLMIFPIWLGDKLVEIKMAFFDQQKPEAALEQKFTSYKRFVFTMQLDNLGEVVASAVMHDKHVKLNFTTGQSDSTTFLSSHMSDLMGRIESMGWVVDKIEYATLAEHQYEPTVAAVVEHYAAKDSISRVF